MATRTRPGRPVQQSRDARDAIVNSACLRFASQGIQATSNRQIAEGAHVTAAMVHYYFRRREDLYLAVLTTAFEPLIRVLRKVPHLDGWVLCFHQHLSSHPWLPHLMIREVLVQNGELRALFLQHFAPHVYGSIKAMVAAECGENLDVDRHVVLLMGMLVYPFLGLEIAQNVTGRTFDRPMLDGFRDDALQLFLTGVRNRET